MSERSVVRGELIPLNAGRLHVLLEGADLRYVSYGGTELIRRVYMAVRDLAWGTVAPTIVHRELEAESASFTVRAQVTHHQDEIGLQSVIEARGHEDGTIEYTMRSQAVDSFAFAKIGLNVHHPIAGLVGRGWRGARADGEWRGIIPERVVPQIHLRSEGWDLPMFPPVHQLWLDHKVGTVHFDFGGHPYEMEDHRNWSDQSLKTYSMPAETGYHHRVAEGDELAEHIRVTFSPHRAHARRSRRKAGPPESYSGRIRLGAPTARRLPSLGLIQSGPLSEDAAPLIESARPAHLRLELDLGGAGWEDELQAGIDACARTGASAELAIFLAAEPRVALNRIGSIVRERGVAVSRVLVFRRDEDATPPGWTHLVKESLRIDAPIGGGAHLNFAELNRAWPDLHGFDAVAYPVSPQVHAIDDLSVVENLEAQREQVRTSRARVGRRAIAVGPVTLEPRWRLAPVPDARQRSLFGAAWTLGSIKMLTEAGVDSITLCDTTGARGAVGWAEADAPVAHPLLHVLADASGLRGGEVLSCRSGEEPWLCGLAIRGADRTALLLANLSPARREIRLLLPGHTEKRLRILDDSTVETSRHEWQRFRSSLFPLADGEDTLALGPYATAHLELG